MNMIVDVAANPQGTDLLIDAVIAPKLSFATHQNDVPVIRELKLVNLGPSSVENVVLSIRADPPVFAPREWRFDRVAAGGEVRVAGSASYWISPRGIACCM